MDNASYIRLCEMHGVQATEAPGTKKAECAVDRFNTHFAAKHHCRTLNLAQEPNEISDTIRSFLRMLRTAEGVGLRVRLVFQRVRSDMLKIRDRLVARHRQAQAMIAATVQYWERHELGVRKKLRPKKKKPKPEHAAKLTRELARVMYPRDVKEAIIKQLFFQARAKFDDEFMVWLQQRWDLRRKLHAAGALCSGLKRKGHLCDHSIKFTNARTAHVQALVKLVLHRRGPVFEFQPQSIGMDTILAFVQATFGATSSPAATATPELAKRPSLASLPDRPVHPLRHSEHNPLEMHSGLLPRRHSEHSSLASRAQSPTGSQPSSPTYQTPGTPTTQTSTSATKRTQGRRVTIATADGLPGSPGWKTPAGDAPTGPAPSTDPSQPRRVSLLERRRLKAALPSPAGTEVLAVVPALFSVESEQQLARPSARQCTHATPSSPPVSPRVVSFGDSPPSATRVTSGRPSVGDDPASCIRVRSKSVSFGDSPASAGPSPKAAASPAGAHNILQRRATLSFGRDLGVHASGSPAGSPSNPCIACGPQALRSCIDSGGCSPQSSDLGRRNSISLKLERRRSFLERPLSSLRNVKAVEGLARLKDSTSLKQGSPPSMEQHLSDSFGHVPGIQKLLSLF